MLFINHTISTLCVCWSYLGPDETIDHQSLFLAVTIFGILYCFIMCVFLMKCFQATKNIRSLSLCVCVCVNIHVSVVHMKEQLLRQRLDGHDLIGPFEVITTAASFSDMKDTVGMSPLILMLMVLEAPKGRGTFLNKRPYFPPKPDV